MKIILQAFIAFLITNCLPAAAQRIDTLAFSLNNKLLVFDGKINGQVTKFAFDTGAATSVVNSSNADNTTLRKTGKQKVKDSNAKIVKMQKAIIDSLSIGSYNFRNIEATAYDMPFLLCNNYYLLGADVINKLHWQFNFTTQQVFISNEAFSAINSNYSLSFFTKNARHFTQLTVGGFVLKNCLIDFGFSGILDIPNNTAEINTVITEKEKTGKVGNYLQSAMGLSSVSKGVEEKVLLLDSIQIGNAKAYNVKTAIREMVSLKIGLGFFSAFCTSLIINPDEKRYYFNKAITPIPTDFGFDVKCSWENDKIIVVGKNLKLQSAATNFSIGEEVASIDGKTAKDFGSICNFYKHVFNANRPTMVLEKVSGEKFTIGSSGL